MSEITPARLRRGYGPIYRRITRCGPELTVAGKLVLINILEHVGQSSKAWPSQETVARETGLSSRTVWTALRELDKIGFLDTDRRGQGKTNIYSLRLDVLLDWAEHPRVAKFANQDSQEVRNQNGNSCESSSLPEIPKEEQQTDRHVFSDDERRRSGTIQFWLRKEMANRFGESVVKKALAKESLHSLWRKAFDLVKQDEAEGRHKPLKDYLSEAAYDDGKEREQMAHRDEVYSRPQGYAEAIEPHPLVRAWGGS